MRKIYYFRKTLASPVDSKKRSNERTFSMKKTIVVLPRVPLFQFVIRFGRRRDRKINGDTLRCSVSHLRLASFAPDDKLISLHRASVLCARQTISFLSFTLTRALFVLPAELRLSCENIYYAIDARMCALRFVKEFLTNTTLLQNCCHLYNTNCI